MKFYIKQKVFSFKDKFKVTDESQNLLYQVKGKVFSIANKMQFLDKNGNVLFIAKRKVLRLLAKYFILDKSEQEVATIERKFSLKPKFDLSILRKEQTVEGSLFAHSFTILDNGRPVASIQKRIISWGDTYEIEVFVEENFELYLFVVIIIDQVLHERKK